MSTNAVYPDVSISISSYDSETVKEELLGPDLSRVYHRKEKPELFIFHPITLRFRDPVNESKFLDFFYDNDSLKLKVAMVITLLSNFVRKKKRLTFSHTDLEWILQENYFGIVFCLV